MIMGKIQDTFTSTDPKMVELRTQMFCQASVLCHRVKPPYKGRWCQGPKNSLGT
jgi:hypothetical protein